MDPDEQSFAPAAPGSEAPARLDETDHAQAKGDTPDAYVPDAGVPDADVPDADGADAAMPAGAMPEGMDENRDIWAENVTLSQGGARDIEATTVSITQGGAAQVSAQQMTVSQGGVAIARADHLNVNEGGSAFAVISDQATINEGGNVLVLVAGEVSGDARPLLDWRSALALAAGLVVAWRLVRRIFQGDLQAK